MFFFICWEFLIQQWNKEEIVVDNDDVIFVVVAVGVNIFITNILWMLLVRM